MDAVDHRVLRWERHDAAARDGGPAGAVLLGVELENDEGVQRRVIKQAGADSEEQVHLTQTGSWRIERGEIHVDRVEGNRPGGLAEVVHGEAWVVGHDELWWLELHEGRGRAEEGAPDGAVGRVGDAGAGDEALLLRRVSK